MRAVLVLVAAGVFVTAWACSGEFSYGAGPGGPVPRDSGWSRDAGVTRADAGTATGLALESACQVLNATRCEYLQRCDLVESGDAAREDCELYLATTDCGPAAWPARVLEGTLRYDGDSAQACAQAWAERACASFESEPAVCASITAPAALLGGKCFGGPQQECVSSVCTGGTCPRQCRLPGGSGDVCEVNADCQSGFFCRRTVSGSALGTCSAYRASGESCDPQRPCQAGYYCGEFGVCQPLKKVGDPCVTGACEKSAYCAVTANGSVCAPRLGEGRTCGADAECEATLLCLTETKTCATPGPIAAGEPCSRRQFCEVGLTCVGTRPDPTASPTLGACATAIADGGACTSSFDCEKPLACDLTPEGGTCGPRLDDGAACVEDRDCALFSECLGGQCTRIPRAGEPCPAGECLYGNCEPGGDGGLVCEGLGGPNAPCERDEQCASLRCVFGACLAACTP